MRAFDLKKRVKVAKDKHHVKNVILLENEEQVKNCLKRLKQIKGQKLIIALSPFAIYELEKQGVPYKILEDYYNPKELYKLGIHNYKKVEDLCDKIDKSIHHACPALAELGIRPALFSFYHLKIIYDAATIRLFQLSKLISAEKVDALYVYDSKRYPFGISENASYLFFDNRESIYARLLACEGWGVPVGTLPVGSTQEDPHLKRIQTEAKPSKKRLMWWLQRHPRLFDLVAEAQKRGWRGFFGSLKGYLSADKDLQVILFGAGYNWDDCRGELQSVGINPFFIRIWDNLEYWMNRRLSDKVDAGTLHDVWERLRKDDKFRKFLILGDVDFFPVLEERLRFLVEQLVLACLNAYEEITETIKKTKVKALLSPNFASCTSRSASQAARNSNIPVVTWQHGAYMAAAHPIVNYIDLMGSDTYFAFGEGVVEKYKEAAKRFNTRILPIGSSSLEALYRTREPNKAKKIVRLTPGKKVVLYVTTNFYQNNLYISYPPPFSDNQFWRTQRAILDILAKYGDYTVVVKTFPSHIYREPPMRSYAEENGFKNCQFVKDECSFTDLLPIADLLVIDFLSTPLLEALTTSKPMFVYTGNVHLDPQAKKLLERRAFSHQELKDLVNALEKYLSTGKIDKHVDLNNDDFLKFYGISSKGKGSGARAAKMLKTVISGVE
jgi:hypothetical protein